LFGVIAGDAHGLVVALLFGMPALFTVPLLAALLAVPCGLAVEACAFGVVLFGLFVVIAGHGATAFGLLPPAAVVAAPLVAPAVPVVEVAPAGTFEF